MKTSIAIYPGSFDPVTNGHLDLIERGEKMFDLLIVAVLRNSEKQPLFTVPERVEMLREVTKKWADVEVDVFEGLLVDYARRRGAGVILRGIRAVSDYEYELQMALMNRKLEPRLETVHCAERRWRGEFRARSGHFQNVVLVLADFLDFLARVFGVNYKRGFRQPGRFERKREGRLTCELPQESLAGALQSRLGVARERYRKR